MKYTTPLFRRPNARALAASLIAYLMLAAPLAPLAAPRNAGAARTGAPAPPAAAPDRALKAAPAPVPAPLAAASLSVTKVDTVNAVDNPAAADPGDTITYTVTITNTGNMDATNVTLTDTVDSNTTLQAGTVMASPIGFDDAYNAIGNVGVAPNAAQGMLANDIDPDSGNNTGLTVQAIGADNSAPFSHTTGNGGLVEATTTDGAFTYTPAPGFSGSDTFTYTTVDGTGKTNTATVTITVGAVAIWFIDDNAAPDGNGTLAKPFNCYTGTSVAAATTCFSDTAADDPGDIIFLFAGTYTGGYTLLNNQRLLGQGTSVSLASAAGVTAEPYAPALPANNSDPTTVVLTTASGNAVNLGAGNSNTLRGFTGGNTGGADIASTASGFGTLTVSEVVLNGNGQALNLDSGTLAATFVSISSNTSGAQGILLDQVLGTLTATGGTGVTDPATQCILVTASTANIDFGNTNCTLATDGISLQNNSAGTRTFGTLSVSGASGNGFVHALNGGAVNVTGATTITTPGGDGIDISGSSSAVNFAGTTITNPTGIGIDIGTTSGTTSFGATTVNKGSTTGVGVNFNTDTGTTNFSTLAITTSSGTGLNATTGGTINVTTGAGSFISATGTGATFAPAISATGATTFGAAFSSLASTNSGGTGTGLSLNGTSGLLTSSSTNIQNPGGIGISVASSSLTLSLGNTTVNGSGGDAVDLSTNSGAITFTDLDLTPDANQRGLDAQNNTGTITSTSGDVATTGAPALFIDGPAGRTPLAMTLTNVDSTNSATEGVDIREVSGSFTVNDPGTAVNISNPNGFGLRVQNSTATFNFGNAVVNGSNDTGVVLGTASNGNTGTITFADLDIAPDSGDRGLHAVQNTAAITTTSGTITTTNNVAVEIAGTSSGSRTPLNVQLTTVNTTGGSVAANGIALTNTSASGSPGGFRVLGTGGTCTEANQTGCTGGRITATAGGDDATPEDAGGIGVRLNNVEKVFFTRMRIDNHPNFAVYGTGVVGFNLDTSVLDGTNGGNASFDEGAISLRELTGTTGAGTASSITNSFLTGGHEFLLDVRNFTSNVTLDRLTVTNNTFGTLHVSGGDDAAHFDGLGSGQTFRVTFSNNVVRQGRGDMVNYNVGNGGTMSGDFVMRNNTMHNTHSAILSGGGGVTIAAGGVTNHNGIVFDIACNSIRGSKGFGLLVAKAGTGSSGTVNTTIFNNRIGADGVVNSASSEAAGINVDSRGGGTHNVLIKNNQVHNWGANGAYQIFNNQGNVTMNVTIQGNLSNNPDAEALAGLYAETGALSGDTSITNMLVGGAGANENDFREGDFFDGNDVLLSRIAAGAGTQFNLSRGVSGASNVQQIITDNNVDPVTAAGAGTITFVNTTPTLPPALDQTCAPPSGPVIFEGIQSESRVEQVAAPTVTVEQPVVVAAPATTATGEKQAESSMGGGVTSRPFVIVPAQPQAKRNGGPRLRHTEEDSALRIEGADEARQQAQQTKSKWGAPRTHDVPTANPPVIMGNNIVWNIGTLPAGKSVTITFQAKINDPLPGGTTQVSNQATVTADGGISVLSDDPSEAGSNNATVTPINAPPTIFIRDAEGSEPGELLFTVTLSNPSTSVVSVNFTTNDGTATVANGDYTPTSGTVTFQPGERVQTIAVPILSDASPAESPETITVTLSMPVNGVINPAVGGDTATGTITEDGTPGMMFISELRTSGPAGDADDFVEIANHTAAPVTVAASDSSAGWGLFKMGADCDATPVLVGIIPNGTIIPARGHYLFTGSAYSLANYGGTGAAAGNLTLSPGLEPDANVAIFDTSDIANLSTVTRLDAVGFGLNNQGNCKLLREGSNLGPASGSTLEHTYFRKACQTAAECQGSPTGTPTDTSNNATDFIFADTTGTQIVGTGQRLGAPGPENIGSPRRSDTMPTVFLDAGLPGNPGSQPPNRVRDLNGEGNNPSYATFGTMTIRRRVINNTGGNVTRLRFRISEMTTFPSATADLRALTSMATSGVMITNDSGTCGGPSSCTVTVEGTTLEQPPNQPIGGGLNATLTVTLGTPLPAGQSVNVQFLLGVQQSGTFRFFFVVEALP